MDSSSRAAPWSSISLSRSPSEACACPFEPDKKLCSTSHSVNGPYVSGLGLDPTAYEDGYADRDLDWFFDLPADVTDLEGENARDLYHRRLSSRRQNRLWTPGPDSTIEYDDGGLRFDTDGSRWVELTAHDALHLDRHAEHSVSVDLDADAGYCRICLEDSDLDCSGWFMSNGTPTTHTVQLYAESTDERLVLQGWNARGRWTAPRSFARRVDTTTPRAAESAKTSR